MARPKKAVVADLEHLEQEVEALKQEVAEESETNAPEVVAAPDAAAPEAEAPVAEAEEVKEVVEAVEVAEPEVVAPHPDFPAQDEYIKRREGFKI